MSRVDWLKTKRIAFSYWQKEDLSMAQQLWGRSSSNPLHQSEWLYEARYQAAFADGNSITSRKCSSILANI
ncbi:hypothetical protein [Pediococcus ethanolidurans]|uniref:hypothetical protein n=1 Tax=Pediococcus ethanolidurans TaxID=319653 RepID=UPI0021AA5DF2|nr:hypothetical protein [Pediococcus ethanolidurans]